MGWNGNKPSQHVGVVEGFLSSRSEALARNEIPGATGHRVLGYNAAVGDTIEDLGEVADTIVLPSAATACEVVSSDDEDGVAGAGALTIEVHNLDANYAEVSQLITMNGTTPVTVDTSILRSNNIHIMTGAKAAGNIDIRAVSGGQVYNRIAAGGSMSLQAHYTIPAANEDGEEITAGYIAGWSGGLATVNVNTIGRVFLCATADWDSRELVEVYHFQDILMARQGGEYHDIDIRLPLKCDIKISAQRTVGAATLQGTGSIDIYHE